MICAVFNDSNTRCSLVEIKGQRCIATPFSSTSEMIDYINENHINLPADRCFAGWKNFRSWLKEAAM